MATKQATSSYSMSRQLHDRFKKRLPKHGTRSKLVARLIEAWLDGEIGLSVSSVALSNIKSQAITS